MIAFLKGIVHHKTEYSIILDTGNIGYEVFIPADLLYELSIGEELFLNIYQQTKEDGNFLYGFSCTEDLDLFRKLVSVSGVGPKMALAMFSVKSRQEIILAILNDRSDVLSEVNGIGAKTAKRMILELKETLSDWLENIGDEGTYAVSDASGFGGEVPPASGQYREALDGLVSLGYTRKEVESMLQGALNRSPGCDSGVLITMVLQEIGKKRSY